MLFEFFDPEQSLLDALSGFRCDTDIRLPERVIGTDKWLASSALQKAIRRGRVDQALKAAFVLMQVDEAYLWRRLKVIALEDIGVADMALAGQVLWGAGKKQWQERHGGREFILKYFICSLCGAKKCRSLDDSLYVANFHPLYASQRRSFSDLSEVELFEKFSDPALDVAERVLMTWYLCGTVRYPAENLDIREGRPDALVDLVHYIGAPPFIADILNMAKGNEFFISLLPCWMQLEQSSCTEVVPEIQSSPVMIGDWPSESLDKHTRPGKMAFREFLNRCPEVSAFMRQHLPMADHVDVMGYAVFGIEGRLLDRRLDFDGATCLLELAIESWLQHPGMSQIVRSDLLVLIERNIEILHESRRNIYKLHSSAKN